MIVQFFKFQAVKFRDFGVKTTVCEIMPIRNPYHRTKESLNLRLLRERQGMDLLRYSYEFRAQDRRIAQCWWCFPVLRVYAITTRRGRRCSVGLYAPRGRTTRSERTRARKGERNSKKEEGCPEEERRWVREREGWAGGWEQQGETEHTVRSNPHCLASGSVSVSHRRRFASLLARDFLRVLVQIVACPPIISRDQWARDISAATSGHRSGKL